MEFHLKKVFSGSHRAPYFNIKKVLVENSRPLCRGPALRAPSYFDWAVLCVCDRYWKTLAIRSKTFNSAYNSFRPQVRLGQTIMRPLSSVFGWWVLDAACTRFGLIGLDSAICHSLFGGPRNICCFKAPQIRIWRFGLVIRIGWFGLAVTVVCCQETHVGSFLYASNSFWVHNFENYSYCGLKIS